jgi:predicted GNAT family acetyltransferase
MRPSLTVPGKFAVKVLQGRGLTLNVASRTIRDASREGFAIVPTGTGTFVVTHENRRYTIR